MSVSTDPPVLAPPRRSPLVPAIAAAASVLCFGPVFVGSFRPPPRAYPDFVQEWLSARSYWTGHPVYSPQREAALRHTGVDVPDFDVELPWNAHPPVAVLLSLPFGLTADYPASHLVWNLTTFSLFVVGLVLIARELRLPLTGLTAAAAVVLVVSWHSLHNQLFQGQLNCLLLFLLTAAWAADRRGYAAAAGAAAGAAAAAKLFPGLLLVYFAATGRWRAAAVTVLTVLALHLLALAVFGPAAFEAYIRDVMPSLDVFRQSWQNISLNGYWTRVGVSLGWPGGGAAVAAALQLAVVGLVWRAGRKAADVPARDRAFALAVLGMPLASPVAWTHYLVFLPLPLLIVWRHPPRGPALAALAAGTAALWLPEGSVPELFVGPTGIPKCGRPVPADPVTAIVGLATFTAALAALFLVAAFARPAREVETRRENVV